MGSSSYIWNIVSSNRNEIAFKYIPSKCQKDNMHLEIYFILLCIKHYSHFMGAKKKWLLRLFFNNMYIRGFGGSTFLLSVSDQNPQCRSDCHRMISLHPCCVWCFEMVTLFACVCTGVEWLSGHTLTLLSSVKGFQCASVQESWRWRGVHLLWETFGICFVSHSTIGLS